MNDYLTQIISSLNGLGIVKGDTLMVHASLRSLGHFNNRTEIVTDALLKAIGSSGTLLMPALSYEHVTSGRPLFNVSETPSCVGGLSEYFRKIPGVKRSIHPTHSVCAYGLMAESLLTDHYLDHTPCGPNSPFTRLRDYNGKVLFLGCGLNPNTSIHAVEEVIVPEYLFGDSTEYTIETEERKYKKDYIDHDFKDYEQRYERILNVLGKNDYSFGKVLKADSYLIPSKNLWEKANQSLLNDPLYFVEKKNRTE